MKEVRAKLLLAKGLDLFGLTGMGTLVELIVAWKLVSNAPKIGAVLSGIVERPD